MGAHGHGWVGDAMPEGSEPSAAPAPRDPPEALAVDAATAEPARATAASDAPGGSGAAAATPVSAARIRSGLAGRSVIQTPVASAMAATTAGAPTSIGSSPTPLAPCGAAPKGASTRIVVIRGASSEVGMMYVASRSFRYRP